MGEADVELRASTRLACEVAGIRVSDFGQLVGKEIYTCAPATAPGRGRVFELDDVVALCLFEADRRSGRKAKSAGRRTAALRKFMTDHPGASRVFVVRTSSADLNLVPEFDFSDEGEWSIAEEIDLDHYRRTSARRITISRHAAAIGA